MTAQQVGTREEVPTVAAERDLDRGRVRLWG
jgi:hypothetical protein